ncbi:hypothetical protein ACO229_07225 [Promicromonospora sp. MS192]|uniref:hypothetical protein n=1 Tax=Promicromonospora sp. MS192 TaxID=3412684 RepID=UPI003C3046DF
MQVHLELLLGHRARRSNPCLFHLVGLAVYEQDAFHEFVADVDDLARILESAALRDGATPTPAEQQSIIATSCLRGLLLQRLLTPSAEIDVQSRAGGSSHDLTDRSKGT